MEKEELEIAKIELEERVATLQSQVNKMVEENGRLRSSTSRTPPPSSPTTLLPPIVEPAEEVEEDEGESPSHIYARVDYSKVRQHTPIHTRTHARTHTHTENFTCIQFYSFVWS